MEDRRLFLLDAYALIYRAYYALIRAPRITSKGFNTSAIFGFCNTLDEILRKENPTHIAVCFDPHGPTFRHEQYADYKAQREAQPEDITLSLPYIERILDAYRIPRILCEGYEADDVIGTLSRKAEAEGFITYMMTPDKDYGQLVTDRVLQYRPSLHGQGFEIRTPKIVCERYGISNPAQIVDLLALEGDASDNIPGCPGVGEKTAVKLINEFGSVENLLANTDSLKGALKKKITENTDKIRLSYDLATICTSVPLPADLTIEGLRRCEPDIDTMRSVFAELEFKTFIKRLGKGTEEEKTTAAPAPEPGGMGSLFDLPAPEQEIAPAREITFTEISDMAGAVKLAETLSAAGNYAMDVCLEGGDPMRAILRGIAFALSADEIYFLRLPAAEVERQEILQAIQPLLSDAGPAVTGHDLKAGYVALRAAGLRLEAPMTDTAVMHYLIDPEKKHTLEILVPQLLDEAYPESQADPVTASCRAAVTSLRLAPVLSARLTDEGLYPLFTEVEMPMVRVLGDMEFTGVRIDTAELARLSADYSERLKGMEDEVYRLAGCRFNISSPSQVGEVLFDRLQIDSNAKRTKRGAYSTTEEILQHYAPRFPVVALILKIRGLRKLLTTYINALPALINPRTGKIHTTYNQTVTATGRLSSTNPNLQNIPIRSDDGREIRRAFIADDNDVLLSADYSQIELRLMADMSGDPDMTDAFAKGLDIHRATAAKIYHRPLEEVTDDQRRHAKTANFGIIYGISAFGLSERLSIPRAEAKALIDGYFESYPHIRGYIDSAIETARKDGAVRTVMGRLRRLPDIDSRNATVRSYAERNAVNAPIQGSAADIIKVAMVRIARAINANGLRSRMIMQVHDELIFNVVPEELPTMQEIVAREMTGAYSGKVRLEVSAGVGRNWLEAH